MWAFNAYETASKPPKTFDVEDFLSSLFRPQDAFVHAASLNQLEVVRRWWPFLRFIGIFSNGTLTQQSRFRISKSHDINALDKEGHSALCMAAQNRCMDVLKLLLESGADPNAQQDDGKTAIHIACTWGRLDAAALLLQHGASTTLRDKDGQGPLHGGCKNGHDRIVELLLDASVDPFVADDCGATPFDLARDWQRLDILRILDEYHRTRFTAAMHQRVCYVMRHRTAPAPAAHVMVIPMSMQLVVSSFLC